MGTLSSSNTSSKARNAYLLDYLKASYEDLILFDELDSAIVGVVETFGGVPVVCYDREKAVNCLIDPTIEDPMEAYEVAAEYFDFNVACSYVGAGTPAFLDAFCPEDFAPISAVAPTCCGRLSDPATSAPVSPRREQFEFDLSEAWPDTTRSTTSPVSSPSEDSKRP